MSLITRCPACETLFKVVPDQLRISQGWVRCGQCGEIFDASADLRQHEAGPAVAQAAPPVEPVHQVQPQDLMAAVQNPSAAWVQPGVDIELAFPEEDVAPPETVRQAEPEVAIEYLAADEKQGPQPDEPLAMAEEMAAADEHIAPTHVDEEAAEEPVDEGSIIVEREAESQPEADVESVATESETETAVETVAEAEPELESEPDPDPEVEAEGDSDTLTNLGSEAQSELAPEAEPASAEAFAPTTSAGNSDESEPIVEPLTESVSESESEAEAEAGVEAETRAKTEAKPEPEVEVEAETDAAVEPETAMAPAEPASPSQMPLPGRAALDVLADGATVAALSPHPEFNHHDVSFIRQAPNPETLRRTSLRRALWVFAGVASLVALLLQMALHERDSIAAAAPALRPLLQAMCAPMQCRVQAPREIEAIVIDGSSFSALRNEGYKLSLTLRNRAPHALAVPAIELSLTDIREQPVLRRVLLPSEMGAGSAVLPPRGEWSTTLELAVADGAGRSRIVGYRLLAFYP